MPKSRLSILVETAVMIALAIALSNVKVFQMPQGGSITAASMVPILLVGLRHGLRWGVIGGILLGVINRVMDLHLNVALHPVSVLLDYPIAFGALGLAGMAVGRSGAAIFSGVTLALGGRFLAHLVSGAVFFAEYAPAGQSPWFYSAIYNGSYMLPELIISGVALMFLLPALQKAIPGTVSSEQRSA